MYATQIFFMTILRFIQNGLILLYQGIYNNLKRVPKYDITSDRINSLIEF